MNRIFSGALMTVFIAAPMIANAIDWTFTDLAPVGVVNSHARASYGGNQYGTVNIANFVRASMWSGTAESWVSLHPGAAYEHSTIWGAYGNQQVGHAIFGGIAEGGPAHASIWNGTAASFVDIHPTGALRSYGYATNGSRQVGMAAFGDQSHAGLWSGTSASFIDLNPAGAWESYASGISQDFQGGAVRMAQFDQFHAAIWQGTAASHVDLNPAGATYSGVASMHGDMQGGAAYIAGVDQPGFWTGTAASWTSLQVAGNTRGNVMGMSDGMQVGYVTFGDPNSGARRASVWFGSSATYQDLPTPDGLTYSLATGVSVFNGTAYISGYAWNHVNEVPHAMVWTAPVPEPASMTALGLGALALLRKRKKK